MCHTIIPKDSDTQFFSLTNCILVGIKEIQIYTNNKLRGPFYSWKNVKYSKVDKGIKITIPPKLQCVDFQLNGYSRVIRKFRTGIHISPIKSSRNPESKIFTIPSGIFVLFNTIDILFFDGKDVSVESFIIPNKNAFSEITDFLYLSEYVIESTLPYQERYYEIANKEVKNEY